MYGMEEKREGRAFAHSLVVWRISRTELLALLCLCFTALGQVRTCMLPLPCLSWRDGTKLLVIGTEDR